MTRWIFFKDTAASICVIYPLDSFRGCYPRSDTTLELYFTPIREMGYAPGKDNDVFILTIATNKHKDVMEAIAEGLNVNEDLVVKIFDDSTGEKISTHISSFTRTYSSDP
jgi:hypothetical protein